MLNFCANLLWINNFAHALQQSAQFHQSQPPMNQNVRNRRRNKKKQKKQHPANKNAQKSLLEAQTKSIEPSNKGYKMLQTMGYEKGKGLGKNGEGILEPIGLTLHRGRKGLGAIPKGAEKENVNTQLAEVATATVKPEQTKVEVVAVTTAEKKFEEKPASLLPKKPAPVKVEQSGPLFSPKEPTTPQQLRLLAIHFRDEVNLLQLRLDAEASLVPNDDTLNVAKISLGRQATITESTCEFIRTEIIAWIGKYQHQKLDTPIFYSMKNNGAQISIVCENNFAFDCLRQCIEEIAATQPPFAEIKVVRMPSIRKHIYCYSARYGGIIHDPKLFLTQVKLHKTKLQVNRWILVAHELCREKRETHFLFLLDEPSALALFYHHNNRLFICMQQVEFTKRGSLPMES